MWKSEDKFIKKIYRISVKSRCHFFDCLTKIKVLLKNYSLYIPDVVGVVFSEVEAEFSFVRASAAVEAKKRASICTLESGIEVGPTVINLAFFSRPYNLIKGPTFINFWNFF